MEIVRGEVYAQRGSKFFSFFCAVESVAAFKQFMKAVVAEHKKASHYCFAYVVNEKTLIESVRKEKYSNDCEPSGVGAALLNLLRQRGIENGAVIVVRYFGGVLLGAGNLVRAYAQSAKSCVPV